MPHHTGTAAEDPRLRIVTSRRICSSLLLQQFLYYQTFYSIGWLIFWFAWLCKTYWRGLVLKDDDTVRTVFIILFLVWEPVRLVAGWYGNLQENVPWLVLFCILSIMPMQGVVGYIYFIGYDMTKWTKAVQITQALMLEIQLVVGIYTVFRMYKQQKSQYYLFEYAMNQRRKSSSVQPIPAAMAAR